MTNTYFITSTIKEWIRVLNAPYSAKIVISSLRFMITEERIDLHAYVIMPNHIHLIITHAENYPMNSFLRDFHKFTAQKIILKLKDKKSQLLEKLESPLKDRKHQLWQETHAPKQVVSFKFALQKINYIHNNPIAARWRLCERPEDYLYSSARDYVLNQPGILPVKKLIR